MAFETLSPYLEEMVKHQASDLYLTYDCPPSLRLTDRILPINKECITDEQLHVFIHELLSEDQLDEFESTLELNCSVKWSEEARFRVNIYQQQ